jgi:plasmid stabilization system protein ParE
LRYLIAANVRSRLAEIVEGLEETDGHEAADRVDEMFRAAMRRAAASPYSLAAIAYCPANYRRVNVKPFQIFYRINEQKQQIVFYELRHGRQRPLKSATHRKLAGQAEKDI